MNPHEFACITKDAIADFEKWYEKNGADGDREALQSAYLAAHASLIARFSKWLDDGLFANPDEPQNIPEGEGFDFYIQGAISRQVMKWARQLLNEPIQETVEKYNELFTRQVYVIMSAYSGKEIKSEEDDDGIYGEENEARHQVFNDTFAAISCIKSGKLNKQAVANTFRALADFYEEEW